MNRAKVMMASQGACRALPFYQAFEDANHAARNPSDSVTMAVATHTTLNANGGRRAAIILPNVLHLGLSVASRGLLLGF